MHAADILKILQEDMGPAVIATADATGQPHARNIHIGLANDAGIFFMTSPDTAFYQQLMDNPKIAVSALSKDAYLVQVIRIEGLVRPVDRSALEEILANHPFVDQVYPNDDLATTAQVFQLYQGEGFYQSMSQGHKYVFSIGEADPDAHAIQGGHGM
ncbi:ABC transporter ATP-binding protein [Suicoccus acidiformans]|uniref:ABC transporter ATP-binding protein n=1 Tax=Suicoccus acidiformans TaxID=2036206 RepID=A0A347WJ05_9LACT|nr:pyridoxamine 5'-phosphate oxidase family protein [Suicoccus acidiformans]AXY25062.1 ABC transporter ATP-binding protein [Suicoccus acidiformans]